MEEEAIRPECDGKDIVISSIYDGATGDPFTVESMDVTDRCLTVEVSHQGCSSDDWTMDLVTNGEYGASSPTETYATLYLDDQVEDGAFNCAVQSSTTFTFDLSPYLRGDALPTRFTVHGAAAYAVDSVLVIE